MDFSAAGLDRAARLAAERGVSVDWVQVDLLDYTPAPGVFDLVLIAYLHLLSSRLAGIFRSAAPAVAPGGTLLVVGRDRDNIARGYGGPQDPDRLYTAEGVTAELGGLAVLRAGPVAGADSRRRADGHRHPRPRRARPPGLGGGARAARTGAASAGGPVAR